jgi:hypothetical protein
VTINLNWTNLALKIVGVCVWVTQQSLFSISIINNLFQVPSSIFFCHQASSSSFLLQTSSSKSFFFKRHHQDLLLQASSSKGLIITKFCFSGLIIINLL